MDDGEATPAEDRDDVRALAEDWIAIWQSEITAFMTDPETQQAWAAILALWAGAAQAMIRAVPPVSTSARTPPRRQKASPAKAPDDDATPEHAGTADATGAAPADAAPLPRDDEIGRLERRVAELERHLADADRRARPPGDHRRPSRGNRSRG